MKSIKFCHYVDNYVWTVLHTVVAGCRRGEVSCREWWVGVDSNLLIWTYPISKWCICLNFPNFALSWQLFETATQFSILFSWFPVYSSVQEIPICWTRSHTHTVRWIQFSSNLRPTSDTNFRGSERKHINQKH